LAPKLKVPKIRIFTGTGIVLEGLLFKFPAGGAFLNLGAFLKLLLLLIKGEEGIKDKRFLG